MTKATIATLSSTILLWATPAAALPCELHVWPTTDLQGGKVGQSISGLVPAAISGIAGRTDNQVAVLDALLNPAGQIEQFEKLDLRATFNLSADTKIVYHEPIANNWIEKARNSESTADCYYEFRIDQIWFNRHPIYGKDILTLFMFLAFGTGDKININLSGNVRTKMRGFPKKIESDAVSVASAADLVNRAFATDIQIFADRIKARLRKKL